MIAGDRAVRSLRHQGYEKWEICQDAKGNKCVCASVIRSLMQSRAGFVFVQDENEQTLLSLPFWHKYLMIINVDLSKEEYADEKQSKAALRRICQKDSRVPQIA